MQPPWLIFFSLCNCAEGKPVCQSASNPPLPSFLSAPSVFVTLPSWFCLSLFCICSAPPSSAQTLPHSFEAVCFLSLASLPQRSWRLTHAASLRHFRFKSLTHASQPYHWLLNMHLTRDVEGWHSSAELRCFIHLNSCFYPEYFKVLWEQNGPCVWLVVSVGIWKLYGRGGWRATHHSRS